MSKAQRFTQHIRFRCDDPAKLIKLLHEHDANRAAMEVMGYISARLLRDRDNPGEFIMMAEFAEVDGVLTAAQEAELHNARNEAEGWFALLLESINGEPQFGNYDELYHTGITGNLRTG